MKQIYIIVVFWAFLSFSLNTYADEFDYTNDSISVLHNTEDIQIKEDSIGNAPKKSFFNKVIAYFSNANKPNNKKFDFSIIGGPHYSSDTKLGIGLVGAGLYRIDRNDTTLQPSNVSIYGDVSTVGFYLIGVKGNNIFPKDSYRLNYSAYLYSFPSSYWGIGYYEGDNDDNITKLKYFQARFNVEFLVRLAHNLYAGPMLIFDYAKVRDIDNLEIFKDNPHTVTNYGFGVMVSFDNRDVITNAHRGVYAFVKQYFRPSWLWNDQSFSTTEMGLQFYHHVWETGILAYQFTGKFNFGDPSWAMMSRLGGSGSMRGYYEGRYRDKHMLTGQVELRQHIWHRCGGVVWVGAGNVFHDKETFKKFLPNFGLGFRWEFKKNVNVRLDYGFGKKGQSSFIFNINEAF